MPFRDVPRAILIIAVASVFVTALIGFDALPLLRGGDGHQWPYKPVELSHSMPMILAVAIYVFGAIQIVRSMRRKTWPILVWSIVGTVILSWCAAYAHHSDIRYALFARTVSSDITGTHYAAANLDWGGGEWQHWTTVMGRFGGRVATLPPGESMWYGMLNSILGVIPGIAKILGNSLREYAAHTGEITEYPNAYLASAWFGILMPLWSGLTVLPLYTVTKRIKGVDARTICIWWPIVPGVAAFGASWDTLYPLLGVTAFWILVVGLEHTHHGHDAAWIMTGGMLFGVLMFFNFLLFPILILFGLYTIGRHFMREHPGDELNGWLHPFSVALWFWMGIVPPWMIYSLAGGESVFDLVRTALKAHNDMERPYMFWVGMNLWDWALWTGIPFVGLWLLGVWRGTKAWLEERRWRHDGVQPPLTGIALLCTVLILSASGITRGESSRIWLFLSPFVLTSAVYGLRHLTGDGRPRGIPWLMVTIAQAIIMIVLTVNIPVM